MAQDSNGAVTKTEGTLYSGAALDELLALASDLRVLSPDSALAALTEAKVAEISMAMGFLMGSDLPPGVTTGPGTADLRTLAPEAVRPLGRAGARGAAGYRTGRPTVLA